MRRPLHAAAIFTFSMLVVAGIGGFACLQAADKDGPLYTDPQKAGPDYAVQGEYVGTADDGQKIGAQVVALGDGEFEAVILIGGLPGEGWSRGDTKHKAQGTLKDGVAVFERDGKTGKIAEGKFTITDENDQVYVVLEKVARKSATLGAKPPQNAIVLFDGKSADAFQNGKLVGELLAANCFTKRKFQDHAFHVEFRTPFKPNARGQARGNSGVYLQGRYETQVLDSFGLEGLNNECGGIYSIAEPIVNMCYPPLTWQTYDVDFTAARYTDGEKTKNARVTIRHNGVVIHNDLELTHGTPGRNPEGPGPSELYLQGHGNPVMYRNIWVVEK